MDLDVSTPALLFPAISLLFLSYTNRFLHLASLVRTLHRDWREVRDASLRAQIENLRFRLALIRWMQLLGALSLVVCVVSMLAVLADKTSLGIAAFCLALGLMGVSLVTLIVEIAVSGGALRIMLNAVDEQCD